MITRGFIITAAERDPEGGIFPEQWEVTGGFNFDTQEEMNWVMDKLHDLFTAVAGKPVEVAGIERSTWESFMEDMLARTSLHLNLHREWFDMILRGEKKEEYRTRGKGGRWDTMFSPSTPDGGLHIATKGRVHKPGEIKIHFSNGYQRNCQQMYAEVKRVRVGTGNPAWGAVEDRLYYVLELGRIIPVNCYCSLDAVGQITFPDGHINKNEG